MTQIILKLFADSLKQFLVLVLRTPMIRRQQVQYLLRIILERMKLLQMRMVVPQELQELTQGIEVIQN